MPGTQDLSNKSSLVVDSKRNPGFGGLRSGASSGVERLFVGSMRTHCCAAQCRLSNKTNLVDSRDLHCLISSAVCSQPKIMLPCQRMQFMVAKHIALFVVPNEHCHCDKPEQLIQSNYSQAAGQKSP